MINKLYTIYSTAQGGWHSCYTAERRQWGKVSLVFILCICDVVSIACGMEGRRVVDQSRLCRYIVVGLQILLHFQYDGTGIETPGKMLECSKSPGVFFYVKHDKMSLFCLNNSNKHSYQLLEITSENVISSCLM